MEGSPAREIGRALSLSPRTVEITAPTSARLETDSLAMLIRRYAALVEDAAP